jgi:hypothetical protein
LSSILETEKMMFQKMDLFPPSGVGGGEMRTQLGLLERANLVLTLCFQVCRILDDGQTPKIH